MVASLLLIASTSFAQTISGITWQEIHKKYVVPFDPTLTMAQRDKIAKDRVVEWNSKYTDKWVRWTGKVKDAGLVVDIMYVDIDMGMGTPFYWSDIKLKTLPASKERAAGLSKGSTITFKGRLNHPPYFPVSLGPLTLMDVTIE